MDPHYFNSCRFSLRYDHNLVVCFSSDVNECTEGTHGCDEKATCVNTKGSHECRCETGYHGDGKSCQGGLCLLCKTSIRNLTRTLF